MHNYPLAQKYGECSLLFSYGTKMFQLEGNLGGRQSLACTYWSVRAREMLGWFQSCMKYVLRDETERLFSKDDAALVTFAMYCTHVHNVHGMCVDVHMHELMYMYMYDGIIVHNTSSSLNKTYTNEARQAFAISNL